MVRVAVRVVVRVVASGGRGREGGQGREYRNASVEENAWEGASL